MRAALAGALLAAAVLVGCGGSATHVGARLDVVASTAQLGDLVREVAGPGVRVHQILRASTDPHEYEPRPSDVLAVAGARVVFVSGEGLDGWMARVVDAAGGHPRRVDLGALVPVRRPGDPHWWQDPANARAATRAIARALAAADPPRAARYARRARAYERRLARTSRRIAACLDRLPPGGRTLVTDHDAFGLFAARFGLRVVGAVLPAQATLAQASAGDLARLSALVRRERVPAIFPEHALNADLARGLARQTGATVGPSLYGDTLGAPGSPAATYLGMLAANADAIVRGLTGGREGCRR